MASNASLPGTGSPISVATVPSPSLLRTIPGIGEILSRVILYEIEDIDRFPDVGNFISYCRLVKKYGKAKALSIIAQKFARTSYYMLKQKEPFDKTRFFQDGVSEHPA